MSFAFKSLKRLCKLQKLYVLLANSSETVGPGKPEAQTPMLLLSKENVDTANYSYAYKQSVHT